MLALLLAAALANPGGLIIDEAAGEPLSQTITAWRAARDSAAAASPDAPRRFDWRESPSALPPIGAPQGDCGACVAFAIAAALEARLHQACGDQQTRALSRQHLFSCGGGRCSGGWRMSDAIAWLETRGVPDDGCMPYEAGHGSDVPCNAACEDAPARSVLPVSASRPTTGIPDVLRIKAALLEGPLVSSMILFDDLLMHESGVYRHTQGRQLGSHAIVLVGWDDAERAWIARNSWGENWGDGGYFMVAWDDVSLPGRYTWALDVRAAVARGACALVR